MPQPDVIRLQHMLDYASEAVMMVHCLFFELLLIVPANMIE